MLPHFRLWHQNRPRVADSLVAESGDVLLRILTGGDCDEGLLVQRHLRQHF